MAAHGNYDGEALASAPLPSAADILSLYLYFFCHVACLPQCLVGIARVDGGLSLGFKVICPVAELSTTFCKMNCSVTGSPDVPAISETQFWAGVYCGRTL